MTSYLYERKIRIFDYPRSPSHSATSYGENAERLAAETGIEIEFLRKRNVRKEDRVKEILAKRGEQSGVGVYLLGDGAVLDLQAVAQQANRQDLSGAGRRQVPALLFLFRRRRTRLVLRAGADLAALPVADLLQRSQLAGGPVAEARASTIELPTTPSLTSGTGQRAQQHLQRLGGETHPRAKLNEFARQCCPIYRDFATGYHWSVDQCEYATDIVFRKQADLQAIYENLARTAIHTVKPDNIATFLGRKLSTQFEGEMGNRFNIRIEGTRIKHTMGPVSIKLYDKFGLILRIETTVNDLTFFKHYREVEHRDGSRETKWASMQKTIYSLPALRELLEAANRRYLEFLSAIEDPRAGRDKLDKLSQPVEQEGRRYSGLQSV